MDEFALVCACMRWPPSAERDRHIADLCASGPDPARVAAIARRHQVLPLVAETLRTHGVVLPPVTRLAPPLAALALAGDAVMLRRAMGEAGIAPLFVKGSTLAILAYGSLARRSFGDIDMLVDPAEVGRASAVLEALGYRAAPGIDLRAPPAMYLRVAKDHVFRHAATGRVVELHWRLLDNARPRFSRAGTQEVAIMPGRSLTTLAPEALFAYLCLHGAAHGWARLRWLADVAALLAQAPDGGDRLWQAAGRYGAARAAASAIVLAERHLGSAPPPSFVLPRSRRLDRLLRLAERTLTAGGGAADLAHTRWRGWTEMAAKLLVAEARGDKRAWLGRLIAAGDDSATLGRLAGWYWLYPLVRVPALLHRRAARASGTRTPSASP